MGETFAERLKALMLGLGLTSDTLSYKTGLTPRGIKMLMDGKRQDPRASTVALLADALDMTMDELWRGK